MYIEPKEWKPNTEYIKNDYIYYQHKVFMAIDSFISDVEFDMSHLSLCQGEKFINVNTINNIDCSSCFLADSVYIQEAAQIVLDGLRGIHYIKAEAILKQALNNLGTRAEVC